MVKVKSTFKKAEGALLSMIEKGRAFAMNEYN